MEAEKNEERNDEKMRIDIERNTDSEKRLMGYITALSLIHISEPTRH